MDSTQAQEGQSHYDDVLMSAVIVCELWRVRMVSIVVIMSQDDVDVDLPIFLLFQCFTMDLMQTQEGQSRYDDVCNQYSVSADDL